MSQYIEFQDIRDTELARLALFPQTRDKDRYARRVRAEAHKAIDEFNAPRHTVSITLSGVLAAVKHNQAVSYNRDILATALDSIAATYGTKWQD